jgi:eukaryotic-like serine/threonine-protein kinase
MGFLMTQPVPHGLVIACLAIFAGCGGTLRLDRPLSASAEDWPQFGRTAGHTSTALREIPPPLQQLWEYDLAAGAANGAPVIVDSILLVGNLRGELHAIHIATGKRLGWTSLGDAINGTPAVDGRTIYVPLSNTARSLVAFDLGAGKIRWEKSFGEIEASIDFNNQRLYFGNLEGTFFCIDAATGEARWKYPLPNNTSLKGIRSTAAVSAQMVFFGADDGTVYALETQDGRLRWQRPTDAAVVAPIISDSLIVVAANLHGTVTAMTPDSGRVLWQFPARHAVRGHPLLSPDLVVVVTTSGMVYGLDRTSGSPRWTTRVGAAVSAGPTASGRYLYLGTQKRECLALRSADGTVLWKTTVGGRIKTSPVVAYNSVVFITDEKVVLTFRGASTP